ncbi:TPA: hypothetical protein ACI7AQ_004661, partial [Escherichia coli]
SVGMVRVIICHQLNTKNNIISGSEVSRLSVAIQTDGQLGRLLTNCWKRRGHLIVQILSI